MNATRTHGCWAALLVLLVTLIAPQGGAAADPKIIEAAKKEGELFWWSTIAQDQSQKIVDEFMRLYPFIKANYWRSGSVGLHNKILLEARAGRSSWDVVSQTTPEFIFELKEKKLIAPYQSSERRHFSNDLKDKDGFWTGTYALPTGLGFNTQQIKREEAPENYQDPLNPKWKGKRISVLGSKAAHPNAAKLFIDFILSKAAQQLLQSFSRVTLREGVEPNPPSLIKGFKRIVLHPEKAQDAQQHLKLYREVFGMP